MEILGWKSPYEKLFGKTPDCSHLHLFGCLCFLVDIYPHNNKLDPKGFKCVFLGYPSSHKAYKVYDLDSKICFVSRDVVFFEDKFSFRGSDITLTLVPFTSI